MNGLFGVNRFRVVTSVGMVDVWPSDEGGGRGIIVANGLGFVGLGPLSIDRISSIANQEWRDHGRMTRLVMVHPEDFEALIETAQKQEPRVPPPHLPVCPGCDHPSHGAQP